MKLFTKISLIILLILFAVSCSTTNKKQLSMSELEDMAKEGQSINVDVDSNDKMDMSYGGTNTSTASYTGLAGFASGTLSEVDTLAEMISMVSDLNDLETLKASELNDTSDAHLLTTAELKGTIISNTSSVGADEWDFPARTEGWNFIFIKETDQNVRLDPNGSEAWYFRNTAGAYTAATGGEAIVNETAGKSAIACFSTESSVFCSGDENWEEDTP